MDPPEAGQQPAPATAQPAPVANPQPTDSRPTASKAPERARAPAPPSPANEPALEWCDACHSWRPRPCSQCPPRPIPQGANVEPTPKVGTTSEPPREDQPRTIPDALTDEAPSANAALQHPHIDVGASQGTATQLANLMGDDADGFNRPSASQPVDTSDEDPEPPAAGPLGSVGQHESRLAALIADTALEEVNPCRAMDVVVFMDSERLSAVGRRMRAAGREATPIPGSHSPESDGLCLLLAQADARAAPARGLRSGGPLFLPLQLGGRCDPGPSPVGTRDHSILRGKVELRLPTPDGGTRSVWWLQAMAYVYARSAPTVPRAHPRTTRLWCWYANAQYMCEEPQPPPPPPVQICIKRGDRWTRPAGPRGP